MRNKLTIIKFRFIDNEDIKNIFNLEAQPLERNLQNNLQHGCLHALIAWSDITVIYYLSTIYETIFYRYIKYNNNILNIEWLIQDNVI